MRQTYTFDDLLLVPKYSDIASRSHVDLSSDLDDKTTLTLPVISSPMDTVTETSMAIAMHKAGGLGIVHRYNSIEEQARLVRNASIEEECSVGAAIGVVGDYLGRATAVHDAGARVLCVDVAHGHHVMVRRCLYELRDAFGSGVHIMAGNVATLEAFNDLSKWGADSIRVGIGGGSICSTRIVTGHGVPTLQSIFDVSQTTYDTKIIADGGIKTTGDMVKALAAGADFVMLGSMLAGTDQTPGQTFTNVKGESYKAYRGMASAQAQRDWRGKSSTPEGVATTIPYRGCVNSIVQDIDGGLRSGLSYTGARTLQQLQSSCEFVVQTQAGQSESSTHILWRNK